MFTYQKPKKPAPLIAQKLPIKIHLNQDAIRAFFAFLYRRWDYSFVPKDAAIDLRCLPLANMDREGVLSQWLCPVGSMESCLDASPAHWCHYWGQKGDVLFAPTFKSRQGNLDRDAVLAPCLFGEVDDSSYQFDSVPMAERYLQQRLNAAGLPKPSILVRTRKGVHFYYCFETPEPLETEEKQVRFTNTLRRLAQAIGADERFSCDVAPMRVGGTLRPAGTYNLKNIEAPVLLNADYTNEFAPPLTWWRANLPILPDRSRTRIADPLPGEPQPLPQVALNILSGRAIESGRNHSLVRLLGIAVRCGWGTEGLEGLVMNFCANTRLPEREGFAVLRSAQRNFRQFG